MNSFIAPESKIEDPELVKQILNLTEEEDEESITDDPNQLENDKKLFYKAFCQERLEDVREFFEELVAKYPDKKIGREFFSDPAYNFLIPIIRRNDIHFLFAYKTILCGLFPQPFVIELLQDQAKALNRPINLQFSEECHHVILILLKRLLADTPPLPKDIFDYIDHSMEVLSDPEYKPIRRPRIFTPMTYLTPVARVLIFCPPERKNEFRGDLDLEQEQDQDSKAESLFSNQVR